MARKKKSMSIGKLALIALIVFGVSVAGSYSYLKWKSQAGKLAPETPKPAPIATTAPEERIVTIYVPEATKMAFHLAPKTRTADPKGDILDAAIEVLIATNKQQGETGALMPKGTRLLSPIKVLHGVAIVNLNVDFVNNFEGGSVQEALMLNSIAHTLAKNSGGKVRAVRILIEGKPAEPLGDYDLKDPITPNPLILKPGE